MATKLSEAARKKILDDEIAKQALRGLRVESQHGTQAVLVQGKRISHTLHLILTLLTFGLWLIVWIFAGLFGGEKRRVISVDEYGKVQYLREKRSLYDYAMNSAQKGRRR